MKTLKLELDFLIGPIVKDVFSASKNKLITGIEVIDNDLELNELNEKASALYSSFYEFDEDEACNFNSTIAKEHLDELKELIQEFRSKTDDDIVIYTGYNPQELDYQLRWLTTYDNIIIKFGRYVPNCDGRYDDILGVTLASNNQFAANITKEFVENLEKKEKQVDFS